MKFLFHESAEYRIARFLRGEGHDVTAIAYDYPHSLSDRDVLRIAHAEGRILITNDRDFGGLNFRTHLPHAGVIYFRLPLGSTAAQKNPLAVSYPHIPQPRPWPLHRRHAPRNPYLVASGRH